MFGINDPGIWITYLLSFGCVAFALWFGITHWNKENGSTGSSKKPGK
jgi:hypothetical protein